jgi:hypothetical protein
MDKQPDDKLRVEQFYKLLSDYGLKGKTQPLSRRTQSELDKLFPN